AMLDIVSRVTGYPVEMLTLEMDIENDLGIDSIKRVEILSVFEEEYPDIPTAEPEDLAETRTLGEICAHLISLTGGGAATETPANETSAAAGQVDAPEASPEKRPPQRRIINLIEAPPLSRERLILGRDERLLVCGQDQELGPALARALSEAGLPAEWSVGPPEREQDLAGLAGLILLPNMPEISGSDWSRQDETSVKDMFELVARVAPFLTEVGPGREKRLLAAVTRLDGALGFSGQGGFNPVQAALAGLVKTAAIEWENLTGRVIDLSPDRSDVQAAAAAVAAEISDSQGPLERALGPDNRRTVILTEEACPLGQGRLNLGSDDVVVVSGGARGVTARCALTLARASGAALALLGRSRLPEKEPDWLADAIQESDMKKRILENEFADRKATPADLEKSFRGYQAGREITATLDSLRAVGREAVYYPVDVRDEMAVTAVLEKIRQSLGEVTCIIHGAGVLDDHFILDKTRPQVDRVFDTKVSGARALLSAVNPDSLRYLVFFSSVTARMGNKGQVDYAMANEVLNKTAQKLAVEWPDCRVLAMNWGPWDGGMVTSALKREFEKNRVDLIPLEEGSQFLLDEMAAETSDQVEIVVGAGFADMSRTEAWSAPDQTEGEAAQDGGRPVPNKAGNGFSTAFERQVSLESFPVLKSHLLNEIPVVPFALAAEWVGSGALHSNPGLRLTGIDDMRVFSGIKLNGVSAGVAVMTEKARKNGPVFEVGVQIRSVATGAAESAVNYAATAVLGNGREAPPVFKMPASLSTSDYDRSPEEVYAEILFHGRDLHGLKQIDCCSPDGARARVARAPRPSQWIAQPIRNVWLSDPLALDAAFQLAIVWTYEKAGVRSLPVGFKSFRQYRDDFPAEGLTVVLEVKGQTEHRLSGDFTFLDDEQVVVARMTGYEAVMDKSLDAAFKK
ncbi:MAG: SDR family NAD(P)-dependent oxidoreductase, partial [Desulfosudaceae bacterium]